ncbi:MAG: hypothetical protein M3P11_01000 [Actinomycetota bacterium]|nr:hypothetical protein [Actinomycetota bacterium]
MVRVRAFSALIIIALLVGLGYLVGHFVKNSPDANARTYTGCLKAGDITQVSVGDKPSSPCDKQALQISWNQGSPGGSVTVASAPSSNCPTGGIQVSGARGTSYICNGAPGRDGRDGQTVTTVVLVSGDAHCPAGGVQVDSAASTNYICNGEVGPAGPTAAFKTVRKEATVSAPPGSSADVSAQCPVGSIVTGGGFEKTNVTVERSAATVAAATTTSTVDTLGGWLIHYVNFTSSAAPVTAYAVCLVPLN